MKGENLRLTWALERANDNLKEEKKKNEEKQVKADAEQNHVSNLLA